MAIEYLNCFLDALEANLFYYTEFEKPYVANVHYIE